MKNAIQFESCLVVEHWDFSEGQRLVAGVKPLQPIYRSWTEQNAVFPSMTCDLRASPTGWKNKRSESISANMNKLLMLNELPSCLHLCIPLIPSVWEMSSCYRGNVVPKSFTFSVFQPLRSKPLVEKTKYGRNAFSHGGDPRGTEDWKISQLNFNS